VYRQNAVLDLAECIPDLEAGRVDFRSLLIIARFYRWQAILGFLDEVDPTLLHSNLAKEAQLFAFGLRHVPDEQRVLGRAAPLFAAIACRAPHLAREIASGLQRIHKPGKEYREDFLYMELLLKLFVDAASLAEMVPLLEEWKAALDGASDPRLPLVQALVDVDQELFDENFRLCLEAHETKMQALFKKGTIGEEEFYSDGKIWVEGLALLEIAVARGLRTEEEYRLIPDPARPTGPTVVPPGAWKSVDRG
jgi:hypothetical protein